MISDKAHNYTEHNVRRILTLLFESGYRIKAINIVIISSGIAVYFAG